MVLLHIAIDKQTTPTLTLHHLYIYIVNLFTLNMTKFRE